MSLPIFRRPQAERDFEDAFVFIAEKSEDTGLDFLFAVQETLEMIGANPYIGSERTFEAPELKGIRLWRIKSHEKYLVFYFVRDDSIEVVRMIHSARDYNRVFEEEE